MLNASQKRQANFLISVQTLTLLKQQVPPRKQSEFVEKTLAKELKKNAFLKVMKKVKGTWKNHEEDTYKFIRSLRESKRI
jgi:hypothetical protein